MRMPVTPLGYDPISQAIGERERWFACPNQQHNHPMGVSALGMVASYDNQY